MNIENNQDAVLVMAQKLGELRNAKGVTQDAVAEILGLSNKTISKWETGASLPETEYIPQIADYYEVSVDELFGRQNPNLSINDIINKEYEELSRTDGTLKSFELVLKVIHGCMNRFVVDFNKKNFEYNPTPVPPHIIHEDAYRTTLSTDEVYEILINSKDVNMAVMLFGNESNFSWITEKANEYIPVFEFLADTDAVKLIKLIHDKSFPTSFTADFIAKKISISLEKTISLLEKAINIKLCEKPKSAHLKEGTIDVYSSDGEGILLSILTLAYEYMCGLNYNDSAFNGSVKMIREEEK